MAADDHGARVAAVEAEIRAHEGESRLDRLPDGSPLVHEQDLLGGAHTRVQGPFRPQHPGQKGEPTQLDRGPS